MHYYLFLDDVRVPKNVTWVNLPLVNWTIVRNYDQFVEMIKNNGLPEYIAYDHDLSNEQYNSAMYSENPEDYNKLYSTFTEKTGYDCAKWLVDHCIETDQTIPEYSVHSMNPIGKANIISYIEGYKRSIKNIESQ